MPFRLRGGIGGQGGGVNTQDLKILFFAELIWIAKMKFFVCIDEVFLNTYETWKEMGHGS